MLLTLDFNDFSKCNRGSVGGTDKDKRVCVVNREGKKKKVEKPRQGRVELLRIPAAFEAVCF